MQLNIDQQTLSVIEDLKKATGCNTGEVMRDALSLYAWAKKYYKEGASIVTLKNGRIDREAVLPFKARRYL